MGKPKHDPALIAQVVAQRRKRDLAEIHQLVGQIPMADDEYRGLLRLKFGVDSSAGLPVDKRSELIAHLRKLLPPSAKVKAQRTPWTPQQRLVWSLWQRLADRGLVEDRSAPALQAMVERQTGVGRLEWLNEAQLQTMVESLKGWLERGDGPQG